MPTLFDPIQFGTIAAPNRIVMAPLTRGRSSGDGIPGPLKAEYYAQRASAGLIISEATGISRQGLGWPKAPGLWSAAQVEAWKPIVGAVHAAGGRIIAQLWHMGRLVHPEVSGVANVSASAIAAPGQTRTGSGKHDHVVPHALAVDEIAGIVADYANATSNALRAGFDGVQIHAANGYLIDQFLRDNSNRRDDDYGGGPENRVRFLGEVLDAVTAEAGARRTAIRFSPNGESQGVDDSDPVALFTEVARVLAGRNLAFVELREQRPDGTFGRSDVPPISPWFRKAYAGALVLNGDYTPAEAKAVVAADGADAISFGRPFIANPDLARRIAAGQPLAQDNMKTWYTDGPQGYTDYPEFATHPAAVGS
jgi:hypothetical protein